MLLLADNASVSDNLHSANDLADGEETEDFGGRDANKGPGLAVQVPDAGDVEAAEFGGDCGGLAESGDDGAEVCLESGG